MERIDFAKRHQSHGCYEKLVHLGKDAFAQGHAPSVEAGIEAACHAQPDMAALVLDPNAARDPQWAYLGVIKTAMRWRDPMAAETAHLNLVRKACPAYWDAERRGLLMKPAAAFVAKAAGDSVTALGPNVFAQVKALAEERFARMGRIPTPAELLDMVQAIFRDNPALYEQHVQEQLKGR